MYDRGMYVSFANCGLPYYVGNVITEEKNLLLSSGELALGSLISPQCRSLAAIYSFPMHKIAAK